METDSTELTVEQKRSFYRDGFIILRNAVPKEMTSKARREVNRYVGKRGGLGQFGDEAGGSAIVTDLINKTSFGEIVWNAMGDYDHPIRGFAAVLYPTNKSKRIGIHGVPEELVPNYGFNPHLDGSWTGPIPQHPDEVDSWEKPRTHHFGDGSASVIGTNGTPFFQNKEKTVSLGSFTAFAGVALNDQTKFGRGNLCLLKGGHHHVGKFFQKQRDKGGPLGPEGPGWPRLIPVGKDSVGLNYFPDEIRRLFTDGAQYTPDGTLWPKPTPIFLDEGDAVIALHAIPHSGTRNDGADPRMNIYFRLRRTRPGGAMATGMSDHPDRRFNGEFRTHEPGYDPFKISADFLCDHWSEWEGMKEVVAEEREKG